jgi:hypothetical protein
LCAQGKKKFTRQICFPVKFFLVFVKNETHLQMYDYDHQEKTHRGPPGVKWLEPTDSLDGYLNGTDPEHQVRLG